MTYGNYGNYGGFNIYSSSASLYSGQGRSEDGGLNAFDKAKSNGVITRDEFVGNIAPRFGVPDADTANGIFDDFAMRGSNAYSSEYANNTITKQEIADLYNEFVKPAVEERTGPNGFGRNMAAEEAFTEASADGVVDPDEFMNIIANGGAVDLPGSPGRNSYERLAGSYSYGSYPAMIDTPYEISRLAKALDTGGNSNIAWGGYNPWNSWNAYAGVGYNPFPWA
jgi:hypothetical protein